MKKKYVKRIAIILAVVLALGAGGTAGVRYYRANRAQSVEVFPVSSVNAADWLGYFMESSASGTVVSDVSQSVYVPEDKVINEVYVAEGDQVKIGDKLLSYDTTLLELDLELQQLELQEIEQEIESAQADLQKLRNTTPVEKSESDEMGEDDFLGPNQELPDSVSGEENEQARLVPVDRRMLASQDAENGADAQTEPQTEAQQTETQPPQTEPPQTETQPTQEETQPPQTEPQRENVQQNVQQTDPVQEETQSLQSEPQQGGLQPSEGYLGADNILSTENSENLPEGETEDTGTPGEPKMNQSLQKLLSYIRIKEINEQEDVLVADTRDETDEDQISLTLSENDLKLVPHFKETEDAHFERLNTYTMLIKGITLDKKRSGKLYGIARINGNDYPEIGGYTLEQDTKQKDVVHLTLAFHEGLEEQHEISAEMEDMYAEIRLSADEITGDTLTFRTAKKETDINIDVERPQDAENQEMSGDFPQGVSDTEESNETAETFSADESMSEPETVTDEWTADIAPSNDTAPTAMKVKFDVTWYHGTNPEANWPSSLLVELYGPENASAPAQTFTIPQTPDNTPETNAGAENMDGDDEVETETETEPLSTATSESESETLAPATPDTSNEGQIEDVVSPEDNTLSTVHWVQEVEWSSSLGTPDTYSVNIPGILNYIQTKKWVFDEASGTYTCMITMKYLEPEESPLVKLVPFTELTYETGAGGKYYKGSGTKEDPFVFFCVDGAVIRSSFVNWVLGFDADGTARQTVVNEEGVSEEMPLGTGYYVVLEIRESDTITGAFIRSVGLDGNVYMEYGYAPNVYWVFTSENGMVRYEEEIEEPGGDMPGYPGGFEGGDPGWEDIGETYTAEELTRAIAEKELEIRRLQSNLKEGQLKLRQYEKDMDESVVISSVDGYVKSLGSSDSSSAYMVVTSQGGLYLRTTVSEMDLDTVERGDILTATSWESMSEFTASITDINYFPTESSDSYYDGNTNPNSSNYPVLAHIEDATGLTPNEMVDVKFQKSSSTGSDIYLPVAYVRSENGQSYVYKVDANGLLKKQYVRTGSTVNDNVEIKEGLTTDDSIAFPYGKHVKDGAKTKASDGEDIYF